MKIYRGTFGHRLTNQREQGVERMWAAGESTKLTDLDQLSSPKRSTTCHRRLLGRSVLNGNVRLAFNADVMTPQVVALAGGAPAPKLMIRSVGEVKGGAYYLDGNSFPTYRVESHAVDLTTVGRAITAQTWQPIQQPKHDFTMRRTTE